MIRLTAILLALVVTGIFVMAMSISPFQLYKSLIKGSFGNSINIKATVVEAIPLCLSALGISVAFRMQFWNIGGEGQMMMGAFGAAIVALKCPNLPMPIMLILMAAASILFGGMWALIPAFFKAKWKTNETILTLMLNYIALKWITYLQYGPWKDRSRKTWMNCTHHLLRQHAHSPSQTSCQSKQNPCVRSIASRIMRGQAHPSWMMWGPGINGYNAALDKRPAVDIEKAKALLAEAGYPNGFRLGLDCPNDRYTDDEAIVCTFW